MRLMTRLLPHVAAAISALALCTAAEAAAGGQGTMTGSPNDVQVFRTGSKVVPEIGAEFQIAWKMWTLAGEPVGNYVLTWKLVSLSIADGVVQRRDSVRSPGKSTYSVESLPAEVARAASGLRLYVEGSTLATYGTRAAPTGRVRFETGVATSAGKASSNVPGSPGWGKLLIIRGNDCSDTDVGHVAEPEARRRFAEGIQLGSAVTFCPSTAVHGLDALEAAIERFCSTTSGLPGASGAMSRPAFCPPADKAGNPEPRNLQDAVASAFAAMENRAARAPAPAAAASKPSPAGNAIDQQFEFMAAKRRENDAIAAANERVRQEQESKLALQRQQREEVERVCRRLIDAQSACVRDFCGPRPPPRSCGARSEGGSGLLLPSTVVCAPSAQEQAWSACPKGIEATRRCASGEVVLTFEQCVAQRTLPPRDPSTYQQLKDQLNSNSECVRDANGQCRPANTRVPTGVRG